MGLVLWAAASVTLAAASVITLVVSSMLGGGLHTAAYVEWSSDVCTSDLTPFATVKSVVVSPLTASLKVMVTGESSPMFSAVSPTTMVAVGATVSDRKSVV